MIKAGALASDLLNNDYDSFWKDVRKLNSCDSIQSNIIDGVSGKSNITNLWRTHFCNILNANSIDGDLKSKIMGKLENVQYTEDITISSVDVSHLIGQLKCGKAAGSYNSCAEYFKFAHHNLYVLLSLCLLCFLHISKCVLVFFILIYL